MAEWSKAPVLKTGEVHASVGSNPTPSAIHQVEPQQIQYFTDILATLVPVSVTARDGA